MSVRFAFAGICLSMFIFAGATGPVAEAQDPGRFFYQLIVDCVEARKNLQAGTQIRCPVRAEDPADMMGSPSVAVDIRNPSLLVMASLHGGDADGPSIRSRTGLPYTTFTSTNGGRSWSDNYFPGPPDVRGSYGEHPQIVTDPYGHVYIGSLWARPIYGTEFQYVLSAQKFESLNKVNQNQVRSQGAYNVQYLDPFYRGGAMTQYWYVFNPRTDNMTILWHEEPTRSAPPPRAAASIPEPLTGDDLAFKPLPDVPNEMWREREPAGKSKTGPRNLIAFAWSNMSMKSKYHYALENNTIGPCAASTNPVWSEGYIYVGCVADPGLGPFKWNPKTTVGRVELFRFQSEFGHAPQYLGSSPVAEGSPKLGVRSDGRLALFSVATPEEGKLKLVGTFGTYKGGIIEWGDLKDYTSKVPRLRLDEKITEANIQDLEYREYSGAVHLILKETVEYNSIVSLDRALAAAGPKYRKTLIAIDERYGYLTHINFDVGRLTNRTDPVLLQQKEENYNDLADDIIQIPVIKFAYRNLTFDELYHREFVAIGDYGIIIFADIIELTDIRPPGVPPAPPGPPPVPAPALAATPTAVLLPVAGTSFAGLLAFALIANRRKNPLAAVTKGEK